MTEAQMLDRFWAMVRKDGCDRLKVLRWFSGHVIPRPTDWDFAAVRAETFGPPPLECFCCHHRSRGVHWHHIIQVQHGGSSHAANRVGVCSLCHARIHPWMPLIEHVKTDWFCVDGTRGGQIVRPR